MPCNSNGQDLMINNDKNVQDLPPLLAQAIAAIEECDATKA
jgi:hypothetical protein